MRKTPQDGFTLVEMISVLVIMAIVLSIAIPAVTSLSKANAMNSAAREVSNLLSLARQYAITHRTYARVVFPYSATGNPPDPWYRSYAVITNQDTAVSLGWRYVTKWEHLPDGIVFIDNTAPGYAAGSGALNDSSSLSQGGLLYPDDFAGSTPTLAFIEFGPTGAASNPGTLTIQSGFTDNLGAIHLTPSPSSPNGRTFFVDNVVGRVQCLTP